jgi:NAD(P)-dependent dehydrogenase (short-subunit alcohol dehydrogenase family)
LRHGSYFINARGMKVLNEFSLEGKSAVVTGGGSGLGKAIALALARAGADVAIAGRRPGPLNEAAEEIRKYGRKAAAVSADITDSSQVNNLMEKTIATFGKIDILVNNAGIARGVDPEGNEPLTKSMPPIWELKDEEWTYSINTNLTGAFYCCRAVSRHMTERKSGKVINISSMAALRSPKGNYAYSVAKAGVITLTRSLAVTWGSFNVQVNCIIPGFIPVAEMPPEVRARSEKFFPMQRFATPSEVGPTAVFLASRAADYITGQYFPIDGATAVNYAPAGFIPVD